MAKKSATGNSKNSGKHSRSKSGAGSSGSNGTKEKDRSSNTGSTGPSTSTSPTTPSANANAASANTTNRTSSQSQNRPGGLPFIYRFLLILYPILQMLWTVEAPLRPFSAVRDPVTHQFLTNVDAIGGGGGVAEGGGGGSKVLVEPRILMVVPHTRDLGFFLPTIAILEGTERKTKCWLGVVGLSGSRGEGKEGEEEWRGALEVFGSGLNLGVLDSPELPDDPSSTWEPTAVEDAVLPFILEHSIDTILTFDEKGITGDQHHTVVSHGITSLVHSQKLKDALASSSRSKEQLKQSQIHPRAYLLHTPTSPLLNPGLGPLSPLIQHIILVYRALRTPKSGPESESDAAALAAVALSQRTTFISDIRVYWKSWKALVKLSDELYLGRVLGWIVGRSLWVNEWVEVL